jgi:hypothetical protein
VANIVSIGYIKTCGFVKSFGILQLLSTDIKQRTSMTAIAVYFEVELFTLIFLLFCSMKKVVLNGIKFIWPNILSDIVKVRIFIGLLLIFFEGGLLCLEN